MKKQIRNQKRKEKNKSINLEKQQDILKIK